MLNLNFVSPREAYAAYMRGSILVDVREGSEAEDTAPDLRQLKHIPSSELEKRVKELPRNQPVVLISKYGTRSALAGKFLIGRGFSDVSVVEGGAQAWREDGLPVRH